MAKGKRRFGPADRAVVITELLAGATVAAAAKAAGFAVQTLYDDRARCPLFARAWADAVAESARPRLVERGTGGWWTIKRLRRNRFTRERKEAFLGTLMSTCEVKAACAAAGVCRATAYAHRESDPVFAAGWREALVAGVALLEARLLGERRAALAAYRCKPGAPPRAAVDPVERDLEFWRMLHLLREHRLGLYGGRERRNRRRTGRPPGRWSFERTIDAIEAKLVHFQADAEKRAKWGTPLSYDP